MNLFVWDYHGVLEKGNELAVWEVTNIILKRFGYKTRLSKKKCYQLYGIKWYQYFAALLPDEPVEKHLELQAACTKMRLTRPDIVPKYIHPNDHAKEVVGKISRLHHQIVISNSQPAALKFCLEKVQLDKYFLPNNAFAANAHSENAEIDKKYLLTKFLSGKHYNHIIYIGDSPEDVQLSRVFPGTTYLYSHPHLSFKNAAADYKIHDLREVLREL